MKSEETGKEFVEESELINSKTEFKVNLIRNC